MSINLTVKSILKRRHLRPKDMGLLVVIGGPGGSGSSTIAKMVSKALGLHYVYGGKYMREYATQYGFKNVGEFLSSKEYGQLQGEIDKVVDARLIAASRWHNVLIDSKSFAALATFMQIPTTCKIWLDASLEVRVRRTLHKDKVVDLSRKLLSTDPLYRSTQYWLEKRYKVDLERYERLYGIDYDSPEKYNDYVIDTSALNAGQTFNLVIGLIKNARSTSNTSTK